LVIGLLIILTYVGSAWAHGGGPGLNYDPCAKRVGLYYVHMAVYQPQLNRFQEYCGKIPAGGDTLVVFDLIGSEMHDTPVSVDLVELGGRTGSSKLASIPAVEHVSGVVNMNVLLQAGHSYQAIVTVGESPASYTLIFPINVNAWWNGFEFPALLVLAVFAGGVYYSLRLRREHLTAVRKARMCSKFHTVRSA